MPYLELKLIARDVPQAQQTMAIEQAMAELGDAVVARNQDTLAAEVHQLLLAKESTLAVAESLTGGDICNQLVAFSGSSNYLKQGVVSYCNEAKMSLLKVSEHCIEQNTEVSLLCAAQMAAGVASANTKIRTTDFALATTGIAGPSGGTEEKPVGTVVVAVKAYHQVYCQTIGLSSQRSRTYIRDISVAIALDMLRRAIIGIPPIAEYHYITRINSAVYPMSELLA